MREPTATGGDSPYRRAAIEVWPFLVPAWPFALALGVLVAELPVDTVAGWSTSWTIFGGAAQLTLLTLWVEATPFSAILAALVVNARHAMYSAALSPVFRHQPRWFRFLGPYILIDQLFAMSMMQVDRDPGYFRRYYLAVGAMFWSTWLVLVGAGVVLGARLPEQWELSFAVPVLFTGLTMLGMVRRPAVVAAIVGFVVSVLAAPLPNRSGLLVGAVAGVAVATLVDREEP